MPKPPAENYLFIHYGYAQHNQPQLSLLLDKAEEFVYFSPRGETITLQFDTAQRSCAGWHDLATAVSHPCPDKAELPEQYDQCRHCQLKTGFNPAFYHASTISQQQQARNQLPHLLYLAHFAPGVIKVGISWAERGIKRLLDQGARSCLIIKTYPNAEVARQYEAKIATLAGIAETIQLRQKYQLLNKPYDAKAAADELLTTRQRLVDEIGVVPEDNTITYLDTYYLDENTLQPQSLIDVSMNNAISGTCIGMIGSILLTQQNGLQFALPLGKLTGYRCTLSYNEVENKSEPHQVSLF